MLNFLRNSIYRLKISHTSYFYGPSYEINKRKEVIFEIAQSHIIQSEDRTDWDIINNLTTWEGKCNNNNIIIIIINQPKNRRNFCWAFDCITRSWSQHRVKITYSIQLLCKTSKNVSNSWHMSMQNMYSLPTIMSKCPTRIQTFHY